eukprot:CAMPEP_0177644296 /NCGR_PEP_ID=MMETSP0447-20121125/8607_1 /TAXON_ID=0 /ORGANISM="Stygamoeba regulata, Strain BSH-02190019" /LENGTH=554 /DNA_ID=CAMNT_0019146637 /DNA_START=261 /DNA_END=1922 /DNA_ORIENTATION=-
MAPSSVFNKAVPLPLPPFLTASFKFLAEQANTEGLFRVAVAPETVFELKEKVEADPTNDPSAGCTVYEVAALVKYFVQQLDPPLLTHTLYPCFIPPGAPSRARQHTGSSLRHIVQQLPAENKELARLLFGVLQRVHAAAQTSLVSARLLALIFAHVVLRPKGTSPDLVLHASEHVAVVTALIENYEDVFENDAAGDADWLTRAPADPQPQPQPQPQPHGLATCDVDSLKGVIADNILLLRKDLTTALSAMKTAPKEEVVEFAKCVHRLKRALGLDKRVRLVLSSAFEAQQGRRKTMEDMHVLIDNLVVEWPWLAGRPQPCSLYAVYDGHAGKNSAEFAEQHLHKNILNSDAAKEGRWTECIEEAYKQTDADILERCRKDGWKDGTTTVLTFVLGNTIVVANTGDSEAILGRKEEGSDALVPVVLSKKHRPSDDVERQRIESLGGAVFGGRVFGTLAVSRALGDSEFKPPVCDSCFVSAEPFVQTVDIYPHQDQCIVLACDGLWDKLTYSDVLSICSKVQAEGGTPAGAATALVEEAMKRGSMDNVTAVVVFMDW